MTRSVLRHVTWTLTRDSEPDAEQPTFGMQCTVCATASPAGLDREGTQRWCLEHAGRRPSHRTYRESLTLPYRVYPDSCS